MSNGNGGNLAPRGSRWDRTTAICSMFVAALALVVSILEVRAMREHQRLSMSPAMVYWINLDWEMGSLGITIRNEGVGPAFLDSVVVFENERRIGQWNDRTWESVAEALAVPDSIRSDFALAMFQRGAVVRQGGEWLLCGISNPLPAHARWVAAIRQRFGFVLWYRSAYKEEKILPILEPNLPSELRLYS